MVGRARPLPGEPALPEIDETGGENDPGYNPSGFAERVGSYKIVQCIANICREVFGWRGGQ